MSSIRLKSSFPPLKRVVIYFLRSNSLSIKHKKKLLLFPYIPHRNSDFVFGYNNRMLLIQGAYKRQKADHTGGGFGNGTAGYIRFVCQAMRIRFLLGASCQNGLQMARANVLLYRFASSMIRASGAVGKSLIVLKHKPNNHNFFKTGFVASVF